MMDIDNLFGDRQAEPAAACGAMAGFVGFIKPFKNAGLVVFANSRPCVGEGDDGLFAAALQLDGDRSSFRCKFDRIMDQVQPHLTEQILISRNDDFSSMTHMSNSFPPTAARSEE